MDKIDLNVVTTRSASSSDPTTNSTKDKINLVVRLVLGEIDLVVGSNYEVDLVVGSVSEVDLVLLTMDEIELVTRGC